MTLDEARGVVDRYDRSFIEQEAFDCLLAEIDRLREALERTDAWLERPDALDQLQAAAQRDWVEGGSLETMCGLTPSGKLWRENARAILAYIEALEAVVAGPE